MKSRIAQRTWLFAVLGGIMGGFAIETQAAPIAITNAGFEDLSGLNEFNEFNFGTPNGWSVYDDPAGSVLGNAGTFTGTLEPNGVDFFSTTAPEGIKVAILFNSGSEGDGAYGYEQTLGDTLQANTDYELRVEVGNITSGTSENGQPFDLSEFPGYRVELLAGGVAIATDDNLLTIGEGLFATSIVSLSVGVTHAQLGQNLGIRLTNLNVIPVGFIQSDSPDLEVDFDDVRLSATPVPEPSVALLVGIGALGVVFRRSNRR